MAQQVERGRLDRRALSPAATLVVLAGPAALPAAAQPAPGPGALTTFAGGLGEGPATLVAQSAWGLTARNGRLVSGAGTTSGSWAA